MTIRLDHGTDELVEVHNIKITCESWTPTVARFLLIILLAIGPALAQGRGQNGLFTCRI
jgi:hypothetical protein